MLNVEDLKNFIEEKKEVTFIDIAKTFRIPINQNKELTIFLNSLIKEGIIVQNAKKNFFVPIIIDKIITTIKINPKGFGFVDVPGHDSAFIPSNNTHGAMDEDEVEVILIKDTFKKDSLTGIVVKIIKRKNDFLFGRIKKNERGFFDFIPLNTKLNNRFRFTNKEMLEDDTFIKAKIQNINNDHIVLEVVKNISSIYTPYADINLLLESMEIDEDRKSVV